MLLVAGLAASVPAFAAQQGEKHNWYLLSFQDGECHAAATAAPRTPTPEQFHNALRNAGGVDEIHVDKDDQGNVNSVTISFTPPGGAEVSLLWFPSSDLCDIGKIAAETDGLLPDTKDLK
jgi:hypothetical protein